MTDVKIQFGDGHQGPLIRDRGSAFGLAPSPRWAWQFKARVCVGHCVTDVLQSVLGGQFVYETSSRRRAPESRAKFRWPLSGFLGLPIVLWLSWL